MSKAPNINNVRYMPGWSTRLTKHKTSLEVIGLDTEAYTSGECFMIATSLRDVFTLEDFPACLFSRKYRGKKFVCYNLKYDSGALLQILSIEDLKALQTKDKIKVDKYVYTSIANKCLSIRKDKNTVHIYDMLNFYEMSLANASKKFLGKSKRDIDVSLFTPDYVKKHWKAIAEYCVHDAVLVKELSGVLIDIFESFGVYPQKLYSVAYISYQYFRNTCAWVHVKRYWNKYKEVLDFAMQSYNGGKFEVTCKGSGYYYEYDIVSAYPYEISNLVDIRDARIITSIEYEKDAIYGFIDCTMKIPARVFSPIALKKRIVNFYPVGTFRKVITKTEYDYLIEQGSDIKIHKAYWLMKKSITYPYKYQIEKLMEFKDRFKADKKAIEYHTMKFFLNSFYGKFVQLINKGSYYKAGSSWNPIYGSIITANCRTRISALQQKHPEIIAVHTDSIISTKPLDFPASGPLGQFVSENEGEGIILGSGIYQVGNKSKFRGFSTKIDLKDLLPSSGKSIDISKVRPYTWREVAHRNLSVSQINLFKDMPRKLNLNFDCKRIWLDDYKDFSEVLERNVESVPWMIDDTDSN